MAEWKFQRKRGLCAGCERAYLEGEQHFSLLSVADGELARDDLCPACFAGRDGAQSLLWWRTRHTVARDKRLRLNFEALEALFLKLEGAREPKLRELRYVLCLLLMRKRRLKVRRIERGNEGDYFVVSRPRRAEELLVCAYDFTPERLEELKQELRTLFEGADESTLLRPVDSGQEEAEPTSDLGNPNRL
jgi:hypothetical protein